MAHMHWYSLGTAVVLAGCGTSYQDDGGTTAQSRSALTGAARAAQSGGAPQTRARSYTRSSKDPDARNHRKGFRAPTEAEKRRAEADARTLVEIRPNQLALDRLKSSSEPDAPADAEGSTPAEAGDGIAEPEGDLVTAKRGGLARAAGATAATGTAATQTFVSGITSLPGSVDNSKLAAFPPLRNCSGPQRSARKWPGKSARDSVG